MLENTNIKQFYPGPILNKTLDITDFLFKDPNRFILLTHIKMKMVLLIIENLLMVQSMK